VSFFFIFLPTFVFLFQADKFRYFRYMVGTPLADVQAAPKEVKLEEFGRTLSWFGPFDSRGVFLENTRTAMREEWFHGRLSSHDAELALSNRKKGTFLVRLSATSEVRCVSCTLCFLYDSSILCREFSVFLASAALVFPISV
jgi:hypothetical protein